jgi:thiamine pyrophosphokinase
VAEFRLSNFTSGTALTAAELNTGLTYASYTPAWKQSGDISYTLSFARYTQFGKLVVASFQLTSTTTGTDNQKSTVSLPVNASSNNRILGYGHLNNGGSSTNARYALYDTSTTMTISTSISNPTPLTNFTNDIVTGAVIIYQLTYEAA